MEKERSRTEERHDGPLGAARAVKREDKEPACRVQRAGL